jgi:hypothetical protein
MHTDTIGGTHETDVKEFTVNPYGVPLSAITETIAMPVVNREHVRRNCDGVRTSHREELERATLDKPVNPILSCVLLQTAHFADAAMRC